MISLAQKGRLAYLVADHNIAYGINFPFSRTIVCDDFTDEHSMNTIFQLMSRAGRGFSLCHLLNYIKIINFRTLYSITYIIIALDSYNLHNPAPSNFTQNLASPSIKIVKITIQFIKNFIISPNISPIYLTLMPDLRNTTPRLHFAG